MVDEKPRNALGLNERISFFSHLEPERECPWWGLVGSPQTDGIGDA